MKRKVVRRKVVKKKAPRKTGPVSKTIPSPLPRSEIRRKLKHWKESQGRTAYRKYLSGEPIGRKEAMLAHCAYCMGGFVDGRTNCECPECPLYPWMPYRSKNEDAGGSE